MSDTLARVRVLARREEVRVSVHGYDELAADDIFVADAIAGLAEALVVEEHPDSGRGVSVLVLQKDRNGRPIHVVWGIAKGTASPAVLVTAYRPDPTRWSADFMQRKK